MILKKIIEYIKPSKIFITSLYDTNVDHRALYNFIRVSLLEIEETKPEYFIYLIHFKNYPPKNSEKLILPDIFIDFEVYNLFLKEEEKMNKKNVIECFKSQMIFKKNWFYSFGKNNEVFYKEYDLNLKKILFLRVKKKQSLKIIIIYPIHFISI